MKANTEKQRENREHLTLEDARIRIESRFDSHFKVDAGDTVPVANTGQPISAEREAGSAISFENYYTEGDTSQDAIYAFIDSFPEYGGLKLVWR